MFDFHVCSRVSFSPFYRTLGGTQTISAMFDDFSSPTSSNLWRRQNSTEANLTLEASADDIASQARYARIIALHVSCLHWSVI
jgi:hypothetical protein